MRALIRLTRLQVIVNSCPCDPKRRREKSQANSAVAAATNRKANATHSPLTVVRQLKDAGTSEVVWIAVALRPNEGQANRIAKESRRKAAKYGGMSFMLLQLFTCELPQEVGRLARLAGGREDGAVVLFQKRQPIIDIRGGVRRSRRGGRRGMPRLARRSIQTRLSPEGAGRSLERPMPALMFVP